MVRTKRSSKEVISGALATETSGNVPPSNDDESGELSDVANGNKTDVEGLLAVSDKSLRDVKRSNATLTSQLTSLRSKVKTLENERAASKSTWKAEVANLNLTITTFKQIAKSAERSKQDLLKAKDVKFKETHTLYQKNLKANSKLVDQVAALNRRVSLQIINVSTLNGDLMAKMREVDGLKKEIKSLSLKLGVFAKKSNVNDEKRMEHALQLKRLVKETEELKVRKIEQAKVLKEQTNQMDHKRKLETIEFTATTRQQGKESELNRKQKAKQGKMQVGADQMGVLHGELRKQVASNGGTVPNPGTTPLPMVSVLQSCMSRNKH